MASRRVLFRWSNDTRDVCVALEDIAAMDRDGCMGEYFWVVLLRSGGRVSVPDDEGARLRDLWRRWCAGED